jgi:hypothetical protein
LENIPFLWEKLVRLQHDALPELNGLFPSERWHPFSYQRQDRSAYFSAAIIQGLLQLEPMLKEDEKSILEQIRYNACRGLEPYKNSHGLERYNFWGTNPAGHFPNGYLLRYFQHLRPPDDVDDSVMIYQIQKKSLNEARWLKNHIDDYANGSRGWVSNCPVEYREYRAWCTFFCLNMPLGFDACVITNVLFFNRLYKFEQTLKEQDSIRFLCRMIQSRDYLHRPEEVAPYYPEPATILFHLARLMSAFSIPELEEKRKLVERDVEKLLGTSLRKTERILLEIAWIRLFNLPPPVYHGNERPGEFAFFVLPLTQEYENAALRWLARKRLSHIRFRCQAHLIALELEKAILLRNL